PHHGSGARSAGAAGVGGARRRHAELRLARSAQQARAPCGDGRHARRARASRRDPLRRRPRRRRHRHQVRQPAAWPAGATEARERLAHRREQPAQPELAMWMTRVAINHPVFATMVMVALTVLGIFSYQRLRVEAMPDVRPPFVAIKVDYPGASPEQFENDVAKPIENAVNTVAGVKRLLSASYEGF